MSLACFVGCNTDNDGSDAGSGNVGGSVNTEQTGGGSSNSSNDEKQEDDIYTPWIK